MDWDRLLVSKALQTGGVERLIAGGIAARHFYDRDSKKVWNYLVDHLTEYKSPPSLRIVEEKFPEYELDISSDSLDFIRDQFVTAVKRREAVEAVRDLSSIIDTNEFKDISRIEELFLDKARDLAQIVPAGNTARFSDMAQRIAMYRERKDSGEPPGMLFGIPPLDEVTLGVQSHEYVTIAGPTGMGKTTLDLLFSLNHYLDGFTPMIISLEMSDEEIFRKIDAMAVGLKQQALKAMELSPNDMKRWEEWAERAEKASENIIIVDVDDATPERVYAEASRWKPDILSVDYIQLLEAPKHLRQSWERVGYVSKSMKQIAKQLKVPVYGLAQTNTESFEDGAKLGNLGQSRDIGRHSDIVIGLAQDEEQFSMNQLEVRVLKNRGGPKKVVYLLWDHANSDYREWRTDDAFKRGEVTV